MHLTPISGLTYALQPWQQDALEAWKTAGISTKENRHGVAEVFTGAGKTIFAMSCMADAQSIMTDLRFAIVVPTRAIALQWQKTLAKGFDLDPADIGLRMSGKRSSLKNFRIVIYVIDSARRCLPKDTEKLDVMLIVDECHRAGSLENIKIFAANTRFRLGISATAGREDMVDEVGNLIPTDEQPHIKAIGPVCYRLDIKKARSLGLLPRYVINHHRLPLNKEEQVKHDELCRAVKDCKDELIRSGVPVSSCNRYCTRPPSHATKNQIQAAKALRSAAFKRKQWLYGVASRNQVATNVFINAANRLNKINEPVRGLAFNERINSWEDTEFNSNNQVSDSDIELDDGQLVDDESNQSNPTSGATALWMMLRKAARRGDLSLPQGENGVAIYHSQLGLRERQTAIEDFGERKTAILVSVKALIEGLDVPDANIGVSVASTASARQRIQTMGRILRVPRDSNGAPLPLELQEELPPKEIHLLYVGDSVDEEIYIRSNWSDLTGESENLWWKWDYDGSKLTVSNDPNPPKPPPSETESWDLIKDQQLPAVWIGSTRGSQWSYKKDSIFSETGREAINPKEAITLLSNAANAIGDCRGRFVISPKINVLLKKVREQSDWQALGRLKETLKVMPLKTKNLDTAADDSDSPNSKVPVKNPSNQEWVLRFIDVVDELLNHGKVNRESASLVINDPHCPKLIAEALGSFAHEKPTVTPPENLRTNRLLIDLLISICSSEYLRAIQCATELCDRNETWADKLSQEVLQIIKSKQTACENESQDKTGKQGPDY